MADARTEEEVLNMITAAKLNDSELLCKTQPLFVSHKFDSNDVKLMEVDEELLRNIFKAERIVIRGDKSEHAVLCTDDKTYDVKSAETSNSLLLLPELSFPEEIPSSDNQNYRSLVPREVTGLFYSYLELRPCKPKLNKLRKVLEENPYQGPEYESDNVGSKYTFDELLNIIQSSEAELKNGLKDIEACLINGYWRLLDFDYRFQVFTYIINLIDSNSWPLDSIPKQELLDTLEELAPREILEHCLLCYSQEMGTKKENEHDLYMLKEDPVCKFYAEVLLRPAGMFNLHDFLESWQKSIPDGMTTSLTQLEGLALTDLTSRPEVIFFFPSWDLPEDINERFNELFKKRKKWTYNEIFPYICDVATEKQNVNTLLTKYTRSSLKNGIKIYSSRYPDL